MPGSLRLVFLFAYRDSCGKTSGASAAMLWLVAAGVDSHPALLLGADGAPLALVTETDKCSTRCIWRSALASLPWRCFTSLPATVFEEASMIFDYTLGGAVTFGLLIYLVYALIRPEKF